MAAADNSDSTPSMSWEPVRKRLLVSDLRDALEAVAELRERIEIVHSTEFPLMLSALLPALSSILTNRTKPSPDTTSVDHRLRNAVLEFMSKFPPNDTLRPHAPHLVAVSLDILTRDYEENALLASRIIFDLYKVYRTLPQDHVQPFLDFVLGAYRNMPTAVIRNFSYTTLTSILPRSSPAASPQATSRTPQAALEKSESKVEEGGEKSSAQVVTMQTKPETPATKPNLAHSRSSGSVASIESSSSTPNRLALRSNASFRVLTECPLIMMLMFQLFPKFLKTNIPSLISVMTEALAFRPPAFQSFPPSSKNDMHLKRIYYTRVRELVAAQTKTLSFLTYLLRGFSKELKPFEDKLASNVVALMSSCPKESVSTRKELLVATRHLLGSDFRTGFFRHMDVLLDEKVLMGSHHRHADHNLLRPLGYTTLSELVQHVRTKLNMNQVSRVVSIFSRVLHDSTVKVALATQYAAVRTLLSLIDMVYHNKDPNIQLGRDVLIRILSTLVDKLKSLVGLFPLILKAETEREEARASAWEKRANPLAPADTVRDVQSMVRAIVAGCKSLIYYACNYRNQRDKETAPRPQPGTNDEVVTAMLKLTNGEIVIVQEYILTAIPAMALLKEEGPYSYTLTGDKTHAEHYRDALTYFAATFTGIDGYTLRRTLGRQLEFLVDTIIRDPVVMVIPRHLLASNATTSYEVCGMLLNLLMRRIDQLSFPRSDGIVFLDPPSDEADDQESSTDNRLGRLTCAPVISDDMIRQRSTTLLHLFERVLKSLAVYPENESLVRRHLRLIVVVCLRSSMENTDHWPDSFCMLLRYIFRSISAGKFEDSYKELLPLIPTVLNGLYKIICASVELPVRHTAIELCLTIPARLSSLLPHMNLLLRVIVPALDSDSGDLVNLGLRTLEFWVDNLNPLFLYPEMSKQVQVFTALMKSLSRHLRPAPYPYGLLTLRLLGKLGGKNRLFLREPLQLAPPPYSSLDTVAFQCKWSGVAGKDVAGQPGFSLPVPISRCTDLLRLISSIPELKVEKVEDDGAVCPAREIVLWKDSSRLWDCRIERVDYDAYSRDIVDETKSTQALACIRVLQATAGHLKSGIDKESEEKSVDDQRLRELERLQTETKTRCVILGLLFGTLIDSTSKTSWETLDGLMPTANPEWAASALVAFLSTPSGKVADARGVVLDRMVEKENYFADSRRAVFLESLMTQLCDACSCGTWKERIGPQHALLFLLSSSTKALVEKYEFRLVSSGFLSIKSVPRELSMASVEALRFFIQLCGSVFGAALLPESSDECSLDPLLRYPVKKSDVEQSDDKPGQSVSKPADATVKLVLQELGSTQHTSRIAARLFVSRILSISLSSEDIQTKFASMIRKTVFSRSLRILPLPQQVGSVEALIVILNEFPTLLSIKDQHFLSFLSELLKMCSVADGEMQGTDSSDSANKNGFVRPNSEGVELQSDNPTHCSSLFLRREAAVEVDKVRFAIPEELPVGVHLRTSAIVLLHSVVFLNADPFFDAEVTTAIGNIRPHIVSLLFRSLASAPRPAVTAAHKALRDVLTLSMNTVADDKGKSQSRLPKELLQRCIRPVLLNLRDFTMLSVPLLRGLSRLLTLLNSWFNKTLGEKLLDHLLKWTDPARIMALKKWKPGEEIKVAANTVGIFSLLPHASQFVENLVKTCIKLEAALPAFKNLEVFSPFRRPLARFLDKYPQETAAFFFHRLKTPIYSELFQDMVRQKESEKLRAFLENRSSSLMILNRCFERPLAIMRVERGNSPGGSVRHSLSVHGIGSPTVDQRASDTVKPMDTESLELQYQGFKLIETLHENNPSYLRSHNDIIRALRWLWRSKGRYLRLQHENQISPRFHAESAMLATFLMNYAEQFPSDDVGVLFELILVFLHTSAVDFDFVADFLKYMVRDVLDRSQKKQVLQRFFEMLGGDSNEETKVLTVKFIVYPLLKKSIRLDALKLDSESLFDEAAMKSFVDTALIHNGRPVSCGDRLRVELLKLTDLLATELPDRVKPFHKDIFKICWSLLKMEDSNCKSWAYVVACRLLSTFEVTAKAYTQVYSALLRSHHQEDKELVRLSLDLLVPAMSTQLSDSDQKKTVDLVAQMFLEEANSTPQLAHLCHTVLRDGKSFYPYKERFVGHLVNSVSRLALPPNSPLENRMLAVEIASLLLHWGSTSAGLLSAENVNSLANCLIRLKMLLAEPPDGRTIKVDHSHASLDALITTVLGALLRLSDVRIRSQPFEKIASREQIKSADAAALSSSLEILGCIANSGATEFFRENEQLLNSIVEKCFGLSVSESSLKVKLREFVLVAGCSESLESLIAVSLEKVLLDASREQKKQTGARVLDSSPRSAARSRDKAPADESASFGFLLFLLRTLDDLCNTREIFRLRLTYSLLALATAISKNHIAEAAAKQRQGSNYPPRSANSGVLHHTPTSGILETGFQAESVEFSRLQTSRHRQGKEGNSGPGSVTVGDNIDCLMVILSIVERRELPLTFSAERKMFVQLIGSLLDSSDSVLLLAVSTRIVGKWLVSDTGLCPLTVKEKNSFLWRLSSFDSKLLPDDPVAQPLADLVALLIQKLPPSFGGGDGDDLVYGRSLVACLLNASPDEREKLFGLYLGPGNLASKEDPTSSHSELSPLDVLWRVLHSDFEGLGGRYWPVVFVEALLSCVDKENTVLLSGLRVLVHSDPSMCHCLFSTLLPACWDVCPEDESRAQISSAVETLLARPYHSQFLQDSKSRLNDSCTTSAVRSVLSVVPCMNPLPYMDSNLLVYLAENYNAWHEAIRLLEEQYSAFKGEEQYAALKNEMVSALRHCFKKLGEHDLWSTLSTESCNLALSDSALALDMYGFLNEAAEAFSDMLSIVESGSLQSDPSDFEISLWEERWVEIQRDLCQQAVVTEFSSTSENHRLQLECSWKTEDWAKVRALCTSSSLLPAVERGDYSVKFCETLLAIAEQKLGEVENLHAQTAQLCLYRWQLLPRVAGGSPHSELLHFFHRLVEVRESGQILVEVTSHSSGAAVPDLKNLLSTWRFRLPNEFEPLSLWDDVFCWRLRMFHSVRNRMKTQKNILDPSILSTIQDAPWSSIRVSKSARKLGLGEVSWLLLSRADQREVNVTDAFLKLREQILSYYGGSEVERHGGLNLVSTTNLSFFDSLQKSEIFRLKALFLKSLGSRSKANQAFCHALQISPDNARAWHSWGELCSSLATYAEEQVEKSSSGSEIDREAIASASKKVPQYLAQAMGCFLEAIRIDAHEWSRLYLPKCLWMITKDGSSPGVITTTFESRGMKLPPWVWLPWLPQLLTGFYRPEGRSIKRIFAGIVRAYPQAAYYTLRSFYLERRDVERASGATSSSSHMPSVAYAEEMMSFLRRSHPSLWSSLESILEELIVKFRPSHEEEFLATIVALLERAETQTGTVVKAEEENLSSSIQKTLSKIAYKYFRPADSSPKDERAKRTSEFKAQYRESFETDFLVSAADTNDSATTGSISLEEILTKIRTWRDKLQQQVLVMQPVVPLVEASQSLAVFGIGDAPDLWPGSCDPRDASPPLIIPDQGFEGDASGPVSSASSASAARKAANGAAGATSDLAAKEGVGGDYGGGSSCIEIPGQYMPNSFSWADTRPNPELHVKLVRFHPAVEVVRRSDQLVRRITVVGSDGKTYGFLLQCALSYWTRTDERSAQVHFVLDKLLRKSNQSARAQLSIQPHCVIPVAQRLRLVAEHGSITSLQEEHEMHCIENHKDPQRTVCAFNDDVRRSLADEEVSKLEGEEGRNAVTAKRLQIYTKICESERANRAILSRRLQSRLDGAEGFFYFRRVFAQQWAVDCLLQHVFAIADRTPGRVVVVTNSGRVLSPDARVSYNNQGFVERSIVPFRLSPNIASLIGFPLLSGHFVPSMSRAALAVHENQNVMDPILKVLLRDDLTSFYTKSIAKPDNKTQEMERQLMDRIVKNTSTVKARFAECSPTVKDLDKAKSRPVDYKVRELVAAAQDPSKLCMMQGSYQGWL